MLEHTPTTEEVRGAYCRSLLHDLLRAPGGEFDRWLAAYTTRIREEAVADEWEHGVGWPDALDAERVCAFWMRSEADARSWVEQHPTDEDGRPHFVVRRRPERAAGPWSEIPEGQN